MIPLFLFQILIVDLMPGSGVTSIGRPSPVCQTVTRVLPGRGSPQCFGQGSPRRRQCRRVTGRPASRRAGRPVPTSQQRNCSPQPCTIIKQQGIFYFIGVLVGRSVCQKGREVTFQCSYRRWLTVIFVDEIDCPYTSLLFLSASNFHFFASFPYSPSWSFLPSIYDPFSVSFFLSSIFFPSFLDPYFPTFLFSFLPSFLPSFISSNFTILPLFIYSFFFFLPSILPLITHLRISGAMQLGVPQKVDVVSPDRIPSLHIPKGWIKYACICY